MGHEVIWENHGVYKRFFGGVGTAEFMESIAAVQGSPLFDTLRYAINDFSEATIDAISPRDVRMFGALGKGATFTNNRIRIAVVTTDADVDALVSIYARPPLAPYPLRIFATLDAAREWCAEPWSAAPL